MVWVFIGIGILIWFLTGLSICAGGKNLKGKNKEICEINPIDNKQYKKFLESPAYEAIIKIALENDYE